MPAAARITDPVGHGFALAGMLLGAVVGALLVAGTVATGGLLGAVIVAGGVAMGGLSGGKIASGLQRAMGLPNPTTGLLGLGAANVLVGGLTAARAGIDSAVACHGLYGINHFPIPMPLVAQGSKTVTVNGMPAGRVGDKLVCGADITQGRFDVTIGGPTATVCMIIDAESILRTGLEILGMAALVGAGLLAIAAGAGAVLAFGAILLASSAALQGLHALGDCLGPGYGDIFEGLGGFLLLWGGSKSLSEPAETPGEPVLETPPEENAAPESRPIEERTRCADPVDVATGEVCITAEDFVLPGALPLRLSRMYSTGQEGATCFGPRWRSNWGECIEERGEGIFYYVTGNGCRWRFSLSGGRDAQGWYRNVTAPRLRFRPSASGFEVLNADRHLLSFARKASERWLLTRIADSNANAIDFDYDDQGALSCVETTGGYRLRVETDRAQIAKISLELGGNRLHDLVSYEYDAAGNLSGIVNGSGLPFRYEYDDAGCVHLWADREGTWYTYRYDERGRCIEAWGNDDTFHYRLQYDDARRKVAVSDSYENTTIYTHDERDRITEILDAQGGVTRTEWDVAGNKLSETDPAGRTVRYSYNSDGELVSATDPEGHATQIEYNELRLPAALIDVAGKRWIRSYDGRGNLIATGLEQRPGWRYERDHFGNVKNVIDPIGNVRSFSYNDAGLTTGVSDWQQHWTFLERDALGRVVKMLDPLERLTMYNYDQLSKLSSAVLPDESRLTWRYDSEGCLAEHITADGKRYRYAHGAFDKLAAIQKPSGSVVKFRYDQELRLSEVENERGERYRYQYDALGRVSAEVDFSGRRLRYRYDGSGWLVERWNGKGERTEYTWGAAGQLVERRSEDGTFALFRYDILGQLLEAENESTKVTFTRDDFGRVIREAQGQHWVSSEYDARGFRIQRATDSGSSAAFTYDENGRLIQLGLPGTAGFTFERDVVGRETQRHFGSSKREGAFLRQSFDPVDRLVSQFATASTGEATVDRSFRYDATSNPIEIDDRRWGSSFYDYDPDGRVLSERRTDGYVERFTYDPAGDLVGSARRLESGSLRIESRWLGRGGKLQQAAETRYIYDADGRVVEKRNKTKVWTYEWTVEGQLRTVVTPTGERWVYEYDAFGRRIRKQGQSGGTVFVWDGPVVAEQIQPRRTATWIFEPASFRPLAKQENGRAYACVTDQAGTPRELLDKHGELAWSVRLSVWGGTDQIRGQATECHVRFQGQWFDEESGLAYNLNRYYEPETGRYLSPDPIGLEGGARSYGYVHNPMAWVDPCGLAGCNTDAASDLPQFKGKSAAEIRNELQDAGFTRTKVSNSPGKNETWTHPDGSEVRIHPYGNEQTAPFRSANNAHIHKQDSLGNRLTDRGIPSTNPDETHVGIPNPPDLPQVRGRPHGTGTQ